jgi:hypothetical protein
VFLVGDCEEFQKSAGAWLMQRSVSVSKLCLGVITGNALNNPLRPATMQMMHTVDTFRLKKK